MPVNSTSFPEVVVTVELDPGTAVRADDTRRREATEELYAEFSAVPNLTLRTVAAGTGAGTRGGLEALLVTGLTGGAIKALLECLKVWLEIKRKEAPAVAVKLTLPNGAGELSVTGAGLGPEETARLASRLREALAVQPGAAGAPTQAGF